MAGHSTMSAMNTISVQEKLNLIILTHFVILWLSNILFYSLIKIIWTISLKKLLSLDVSFKPSIFTGTYQDFEWPPFLEFVQLISKSNTSTSTQRPLLTILRLTVGHPKHTEYEKTWFYYQILSAIMQAQLPTGALQNSCPGNVEKALRDTSVIQFVP